MLQPWQQKFDAMVAPFEGETTWLYLDTRGLVTVGRGCQVSSAEAQTLPFYLNGAPASTGDILRDYTRLQQIAQRLTPQQLQARKAGFYQTPTSPLLRQDGIDALAAKRIFAGTAVLQAMFPGFDGWPDPAKMATMEMVWALRNFAAAGTYPQWKQALRQSPPDFALAAKECAWNYPPGVYDERNANREALYEQAAAQLAGQIHS